ncbi:MAG: hypothetical protein CM15mP39_11770 [Synechococcus sp.]|nr:MAG: hypothetical protein CM15mP39_11770 [Synechococcus sp.]
MRSAGSGLFKFSPPRPKTRSLRLSKIAEDKALGFLLTTQLAQKKKLWGKPSEPLASMISIPLSQRNATPGTQWAPNSLDPELNMTRPNVVNVQPVFPFKLSDDWTLVTRTIIPFINAPFAKPKFDSPPQVNLTLMVGTRSTLLVLVMSIPQAFLYHLGG